MPIALYGEAVRQASMVALDGAVQASNADPVKVPGCTVVQSAAAPALVCANVNDDAPRTATVNRALTASLRRSGVRTGTRGRT